jgi:LmbE family N-acetylglucosaminyl deacetylase
MQDKDTELNYYPKSWLSLQGAGPVLCIAPHPDDEVLGCGGALMLLARQGAHVQSLILTRGDKAPGTASQANAATRLQESIAAARIMGTLPPQCLDFKDRELCYSESLINAILQGLQRLPPARTGESAWLFLPSLSEPHPDHQAAALAGMAAAQRWGQPVTVLFYEVGAPMHPNTYLDITQVAEQKWQAVAQFTSQLGLENYDSHSRAMATLRAFGKTTDCTAAEAFFQVDMDAVARSGPLAALPQWPWVRSRLQLANSPQDLPLVSVLIRSMDRPSLAQALASVSQQTYPHIEVVVINATGRTHTPVSDVLELQPVRLIHADGPVRFGRAAAANEALSHAQGSLALFLDDDDLIAPDHLQRLVHALHHDRQAVAAYSGTRVVNAQGQTLREYDIPWASQRLKGINFLPIHAVLFRMQEVRDHGLRFDPELPVLEDWDFWRQLGQDRPFVHTPGITATYRQSLGQSGLSDPGHDNHWQAWHLRLLTRYASENTLEDSAKCLAWHAIELDKATAALDQSIQQLRAAEQSHAERLLSSDRARAQLQAELEKFSREVQVVLTDKEAQLQAFAAESNRAHADKDAQLHQLQLQLNAANIQVQQLQAWQHKIMRWVPSFLRPKTNQA